MISKIIGVLEISQHPVGDQAPNQQNFFGAFGFSLLDPAGEVKIDNYARHQKQEKDAAAFIIKKYRKERRPDDARPFMRQ